MKLHLPHSLRTALLCAFSLVSTLGTSNLYAGGMHSQVSLVTYTDFGQNMGRYRVNGVNELLSSIRKEDDGVVITYLEGHEDYTMDTPMISFESQGDNGAYAAIGYNYIATVNHNGCQNPTFTGRYIDGSDSLRYYGVEYRDNREFCMQAASPDGATRHDYKVTRLNRLITDVTPSTPMPRFGDSDIVAQLQGRMEYRSGSGTMSLWDLDGYKTGLWNAYHYAIGAVRLIDSVGVNQYGFFTTNVTFDPSGNAISEDDPLPFSPDSGDSGSPVWVWDEATQSYLYMDSYQAIAGRKGIATGAIDFTWESLERFDVPVTVSGNTVHIKGVTATDDDVEISDGTRTAKLHKGYVIDGSGRSIEYVGVKADNNDYINTWLNLAEVKDNDNWFAYDNKYYNVGEYKQVLRALDIEDLFNDSNLVFKASSATGNVVEVDADTDMGIGYLQFSIEPASELKQAEFTLQSHGQNGDGRDYMVNSAGFVVDKGVDLHVKLTNTEQDGNGYYYREWRKVGDGNLHLEGQGSNQIFLNVGGPGTTYLKEQGGYAAYNVYAASGATVVLDNANVGQIYRDFTFGYTGATLDFNGAGQMDWRFSADAEAAGFNIHSQSEDGIITNGKAGTLFTLTYKEDGEHEYIGSFVDSANSGALKVVFDGGTGSKLTLHSIHTDLSHNSDSGITVQSGTVVLEGTNTVHGLGSETGRTTERYSSTEDWHYADMAGDVDVASGAEFELGSHARLTGDVFVNIGGILTIREGVHSTYEYIEGGQRLEDTTSAFYRRFYGLYGNIETDAGSTVRFQYSDGTTAEQVYTGNLTGSAVVIMDLGDGGGSLRLTGTNTFSGDKYLSGGGLISDNGLDALGTFSDESALWHMAADAFIAANGVSGEELLDILSPGSQGMLALTQDQATDLNPQQQGFSNLFVGALAGKTVHYGEAGETLAATSEGGSPKWLLGGGGGNLVVDFLLDNGEAELVLGNGYTDGIVTLTNIENIIGSITFTGRVTLAYTDAAALGGKVRLDYTRRMLLAEVADTSRVTEDSCGVVLVDKLGGAPPDMRGHAELYIGASNDAQLNAAPQIDTGASFRFGGIDGTLTVNTVLADAGDRPTGLVVDGQTYSGGALVFAQAASLTGDVVVRGYDADKVSADARQGDITLGFTCNNALADAANVTLQDGAYVNLNGTTQTFRNLNTAEGSVIASATGTGALSVEVDSAARIDGELHFEHLVKKGEGALILSGANTVHVYDVQDGLLFATTNNSLYASTVNVYDGGVVSLATGTTNTLVNLHEGGELNLEETTNVSLQRGLKFLGNSTISGPGKYSVTTSEFGVQGLTVTLKDTTVDISENGTFHQKGTFRSEGNSTIIINGGDNKDGGHDYLRVFDRLDVASGSTLTIRQSKQDTAPTFRIHDVDGSGKLVLDACNYKADAAHYIFDLDTDFAGTVTFQAHEAHSGHKYMSHMVIQSDNALACAQVEIGGVTSDNGIATLGIDTNNAAMQGLRTLDGSNNRAVLMAGYTESGAVERPVSTRRATLTILGSESKDFMGIVSGGAEGTDNGLSVVMDGTGSQTFSGVSVFNDVSALQGTLKITNTSADSSIKGDITVARGANLTISKGYSLNEGKTLHVLGNAADVASLSTALTLAGGTIEFSCAQLGAETPALSVSSIVAGSVSIGFTDTESLEERRYMLSNGNWVDSRVDGLDLQYLNAEFNGTADGLYVTFRAKDGFHVWAGTTENHAWSGTDFGPRTVEFNDTATAVFNDAAQVKEVIIGSANTADQLIFDSTQQYTVGSVGDHVVTADTLHQMGSGTTVINGGVSVNAIQLDAGELLVCDAALLDVATVSGNGTLGIDIGAETAINLPTLGGDGIGALRLVSGTLNATGTLNVIREAFVEEDATLNASTAAFLKSGVSLHLAGNLTLNLTGNLNTSITGIDGHVGTLALTGGSVTVDKAAALQVGTLDIRQGTMVVRRDGDSVREIGTLKLGNGAEFRAYGDTQPTAAMEFDLLEMSGSSAKVSNQNNSEAMVFRSLSSSADFTTLNLEKMANSTRITLFEFGGAQEPASDFTGKLVLSSTAGGGKRSAVIVLDDAQVAANAAINLASASSGDAILGLGVNANTVNIAGLESGSSLGSRARVFSGAVEVNADSSDSVFNGDGVDRELIITTAEGSDYTFYGTIGRNVRLSIDGMGVQRFSGEVVSHDLNLVGGTTAIAAGKYTGHANVNTGAELRFEGSHTVVSNRIETAGAVTLAGDHAVLELADGGDLEFQGFSYRDIDGYESPDVNGFALGGSVKLFNLGEHASVNLGTASIVYKGDTLELDDNGVARRGEKSCKSYTVRRGVVTYDEAFASKAATLEMEGFILATALQETPAELEIAEALKDDILIHTSGLGGILSLGKDVTLSSARLDIGAATVLNGTGRLELAAGQATLPQAVSFGPQWTGTVAVSGASFAGAFTCASLGTADSWLELKGTKGYLNNNPTIANNLILAKGEGGWAFEQNNGNDGTTVKFTGAIKGDGNIGRSNGTGSTYTYEFSGDISGWTGQFISRNGNGKYTMFRVKDEATEVNADLLLGDPNAANNDFRVEVRNDARFNGRIQANRLAVAGGANATLAGTSSFNRSVSVAEGASLVNTGHATIGGEVSLAGTFTNEGTLNIGSVSSWSGELVNAAQGNVVLDATLATGSILNRGTITVSDLMVGPNATYRDARGRTTSGNGFATSTIEVCTVGTIRNDGGTIMYGGQDVTQTVLNTGRLVNVTNNASYRINTTDSNVAFSNIQSASDGILAHIVFAAGTSLKVDNAGGGVHLHSSQVTGATNATLQLQADASMVLDSALTATVEVDSGKTATLLVTAPQRAEGPFALTKSGQGTMRLEGDETPGAHGNLSGSLRMFGGALEVATDNLSFTSISLDNGSGNFNRNIIVESGHSLQVATISNPWGIKTLRVDGVLNVSDAISFSTGGNNSTANNIITGSGIINTQNLTFGNVGTYNITDMAELNVYGTLSHTANHALNISGSNVNFYGLVNETTGNTTFGSAESHVTVYGTGGVNKFATLDMSKGGSAVSHVHFASGTQTNVSTLWMDNKDGTFISLEKDAEVNLSGGVKIKGWSAEQEGDIRNSAGNSEYSMDKSSFLINHAEVAVDTASGAKSIGNTMQDVRLVNAGANALTENNAANASFAGAEALNGDITFLNKASGLEVQDIVLGTGRTLSVYADATADEASEGALTVTGTLTARQGAGINADLRMASGSTLDVSATGGAGLLMGSSVTLNPGVTLSAGDMAAITALGFMDQYTLFTGVDAFSYDGTTPTSTPIALDSETWVKASEVFSNSEFTGGKDYYVFYSGVQNGSNVGAVYVMLLPEPTTGTLSLLALAALAARRRRR